MRYWQDPADKQALLAECHRILQPNGLVVVIDVFLGESESRDDYLDRFERQARQNYSSLTDPEMTTLITHVRSCDYPEAVESYRAFGKKAGFNQVRRLLCDESSQHQLISFETA
jgi:ubiquinone/menaquinone biosynthesis C-methylase UbiE